MNVYQTKDIEAALELAVQIRDALHSIAVSLNVLSEKIEAVESEGFNFKITRLVDKSSHSFRFEQLLDE